MPRSLVPSPTHPDIVLVPLTKGFLAEIDARDAERVEAYSWWASTNRTTSVIYACTTLKESRCTIGLHRFVLNLTPEDPHADHINGDGLDNRRSNLRLATKSQNAINSRIRSNNTSGYRGVHLHKATGKWYAQIAVNGTRINLGLWATAEDAARAYDAAAIIHHGSTYARLNFPT